MDLVCGEREDLHREHWWDHGMFSGIGHVGYGGKMLIVEIDIDCVARDEAHTDL